MKPVLKHDEPLSSAGFKFNVCPSSRVPCELEGPPEDFEMWCPKDETKTSKTT